MGSTATYSTRRRGRRRGAAGNEPPGANAPGQAQTRSREAASSGAGEPRPFLSSVVHYGCGGPLALAGGRDGARRAGRVFEAPPAVPILAGAPQRAGLLHEVRAAGVDVVGGHDDGDCIEPPPWSPGGFLLWVE